MKSKTETHERRRNWVNKKFAEETSGTSMSNPRKARLLKKLWRDAKREIN